MKKLVTVEVKKEREREDDTRHTEMSRGMLGPLTGGCGTITLCTITMAWLTVRSDVLNLTKIYYCRREDLMNQCLRRFYTHSTHCYHTLAWEVLFTTIINICKLLIVIITSIRVNLKLLAKCQRKVLVFGWTSRWIVSIRPCRNVVPHDLNVK